MTLVVVGHRDRSVPSRDRQTPGCVLSQRACTELFSSTLNTTAFIRRIQIQPHHVVQFLLKSWVVADHEGTDQVWFQTMRLPHTVDNAVRRPHRLGHRACRDQLRQKSFGVVTRGCLDNPSPKLRLSFGVLATVIPASRTLLLNTLHTFLRAKRLRALRPAVFWSIPNAFAMARIRHARTFAINTIFERSTNQDRGASG